MPRTVSSRRRARRLPYDINGEPLYEPGSETETDDHGKHSFMERNCRILMIIFLCLAGLIIVFCGENSTRIFGKESLELRGSSKSKDQISSQSKIMQNETNGSLKRPRSNEEEKDMVLQDNRPDSLAESLQDKIDRDQAKAEIEMIQSTGTSEKTSPSDPQQQDVKNKKSHTIHKHKGQEFKTRNRILALGGSTTWGSKLEDRNDSYPMLLAKMMGKHWETTNLAVRATDAAYASQCIESMVREGSKSVDDMVTDFDVILLEYSLNGLDGLSLLLSRLRRRYPNAVIVYVHLWSLRMSVDNAETGSKPRAILSEATDFEEADRLVNNMLGNKHMEWIWSDSMMADSKQISMDALDSCLNVNGVIYEFPVPTNPREALDGGWFGPDYHHLSRKGHKMVAEGLYEVLKRPESKPVSSREAKYMVHTWGKGDQCYSWFETGISPMVRIKGGEMKMFVQPDKWALHVEQQTPTSIQFPNNKKEAQPIELVIMSWAEGMYPKSKIRLESMENVNAAQQSLVLNPLHPLELQRIYHITRTVHIGWAEPGNNALTINPIEEMARPLRVTGIVMCGACVEMDTTYLSVDVGQGHGELENSAYSSKASKTIGHSQGTPLIAPPQDPAFVSQSQNIVVENKEYLNVNGPIVVNGKVEYTTGQTPNDAKEGETKVDSLAPESNPQMDIQLDGMQGDGIDVRMQPNQSGEGVKETSQGQLAGEDRTKTTTSDDSSVENLIIGSNENNIVDLKQENQHDTTANRQPESQSADEVTVGSDVQPQNDVNSLPPPPRESNSVSKDQAQDSRQKHSSQDTTSTDASAGKRHHVTDPRQRDSSQDTASPIDTTIQDNSPHERVKVPTPRHPSPAQSQHELSDGFGGHFHVEAPDDGTLSELEGAVTGKLRSFEDAAASKEIQDGFGGHYHQLGNKDDASKEINDGFGGHYHKESSNSQEITSVDDEKDQVRDDGGNDSQVGNEDPSKEVSDGFGGHYHKESSNSQETKSEDNEKDQVQNGSLQHTGGENHQVRNEDPSKEVNDGFGGHYHRERSNNQETKSDDNEKESVRDESVQQKELSDGFGGHYHNLNSVTNNQLRKKNSKGAPKSELSDGFGGHYHTVSRVAVSAGEVSDGFGGHYHTEQREDTSQLDRRKYEGSTR